MITYVIQSAPRQAVENAQNKLALLICDPHSELMRLHCCSVWILRSTEFDGVLEILRVQNTHSEPDEVSADSAITPFSRSSISSHYSCNVQLDNSATVWASNLCRCRYWEKYPNTTTLDDIKTLFKPYKYGHATEVCIVFWNIHKKPNKHFKAVFGLWFSRRRPSRSYLVQSLFKDYWIFVVLAKFAVCRWRLIPTHHTQWLSITQWAGLLGWVLPIHIRLLSVLSFTEIKTPHALQYAYWLLPLAAISVF